MYANKPYDMILMDCHMPKASGYEAAQAVRSIEGEDGHHIPIIALTADAMSTTRERALQSGMDDLITKPFDPMDLKAMMGRWVTFDDEGVELKEREDAPSNGALIDLSLLKKIGDNPEKLRQLIARFITESEDNLKVLQFNCKDGENMPWSETAHKLKGGAALLKAETLTRLCERAQHMKTASAKDRQDALKDIQSAFAAVRTALEASGT
jgi:CheY-like chemotaxis protein